MKYKQATDKQAMFILFSFGFYILIIALFDGRNAYVPIWTLFSLSGIFLTSSSIYLLKKENRIKYSLLFIIAINILIIISLYGIGFYGTGECKTSISGFLISKNINCTLPGYISIFWSIFFIIYLVKKLIKYFQR